LLIDSVEYSREVPARKTEVGSAKSGGEGDRKMGGTRRSGESFVRDRNRFVEACSDGGSEDEGRKGKGDPRTRDDAGEPPPKPFRGPQSFTPCYSYC
jgi:hypothetical protein